MGIKLNKKYEVIIMKKEIPAWLLILFTAGLNLFLYPKLPAMVPTHWNFEGLVDGYSTRLFATLLMPSILIIIYLLITFLPKFDPKSKKFKNSENAYYYMKLAFVLFFAIINAVMMFASLGYAVRVNVVMPALIGFLFVVMGIWMPKIEQNYFVGFRTPWALENEDVWIKTQKVGGIAFIICGVCLLPIALWGSPWMLMTIIFGAVIIPFVYSYLEYKKL